MELIQNNNGSLDDDSHVKLSELVQKIVDNYNKYHVISEQLSSLQEWIEQQKGLHNVE